MRKWIFLLLGCAPAWLSAAPAQTRATPVLLEVQPAAAPVPALKYQLLPQVDEMNPGNAVTAYLKCFAEQNHFFFNKESAEQREQYLKCPLSDIKPGMLKGYGGHALRQADHAARLEQCDWNTLSQLREQGYMLLIPEVQQMRTLANALAVRGRGQVVDRDFEGVQRTVRTLFALGRHMCEHPALVSGLVGSTITNMGLNLVEEWIQQDGSPNLYWALSNLPGPILDLRKGLSAERAMIDASFGQAGLGHRVWTADDLNAALKRATEAGFLMPESGLDQKQTEQWMRDRGQDAEWQKATRAWLVSQDHPAEMVERYLPEQVVLLYLRARALEVCDETLKWAGFPFYLAESALMEQSEPAKETEDRIVRTISFAMPRVRTSLVRLEQRAALLRTVEAIRLEAARNGGKLPENLGELSVPVPNDPVSGKPLSYKRDGLTALLEGATPRMKITPNPAYEIRLRK